MALSSPRPKKAKIVPQPALAILPAEIWLKIFKSLGNETLRKSATWVCKDFHRIIRLDSDLSSYLHLKSGVPHDEAMEILEGWPKLKTLKYDGLIAKDWIDKGLFNWKLLKNFESCPLLEKVITRTDDKKYQDRTVSEFGTPYKFIRTTEFCIYLHDLDEQDPFSKALPVMAFLGCIGLHPGIAYHYEFGSDKNFYRELQEVEFTNWSFKAIIEGAPNLKIFKAAGPYHAHGDSLELATEFCPNIEEIYLKVNGGNIRFDPKFEHFYKFPKLKKLYLWDYNRPAKGLLGLKNLRCLILNNSNFMLSEGYELTFPNLEEVDIYVDKDHDWMKKVASVTQFLKIINQLPEWKRLKTFDLNMILNSKHFLKPSCRWTKKLMENSRHIVTVLRKLDDTCTVHIGFKNEINENLITFSKDGRDVLWDFQHV